MNSSNKSNKFTFGLGLFLCLIFGSNFITNNADIKSILGFLLGVYNVWQHGFVKDAKTWKIKPIYMVFSIILILAAMLALFNNSKSTNSFEKENRVRVVDQLANVNRDFPISIGNKDSIVSIKAINDYTLETTYKLNTNIENLDSISINEFEKSTREILMKKVKSKKLSEIKILRENSINFNHIYLDSNARLMATIVIKYSDY
jgi:hypothetical protein